MQSASEFFVEYCMLAAYARVVPASTKQLLDFLNDQLLPVANKHKDKELGTLVLTVRNVLS
jgi:hypothetical protein